MQDVHKIVSRSRMKSFNGILIAMWSRIRILGYGSNINIERMRWNFTSAGRYRNLCKLHDIKGLRNDPTRVQIINDAIMVMGSIL